MSARKFTANMAYQIALLTIDINPGTTYDLEGIKMSKSGSTYTFEESGKKFRIFDSSHDVDVSQYTLDGYDSVHIQLGGMTTIPILIWKGIQSLGINMEGPEPEVLPGGMNLHSAIMSKVLPLTVVQTTVTTIHPR